MEVFALAVLLLLVLDSSKEAALYDDGEIEPRPSIAEWETQ